MESAIPFSATTDPTVDAFTIGLAGCHQQCTAELCLQQSFIPKAIAQWNHAAIPSQVTTDPTVDAFTNGLDAINN